MLNTHTFLNDNLFFVHSIYIFSRYNNLHYQHLDTQRAGVSLCGIIL